MPWQKVGASTCRFAWLALWFLSLTQAAISFAQPCNSPPVAQNDFVEHFGGPVVVDVLANDVDPDGEALAVTSLSTTCNGTVSEALGLVTMTPTVTGPENCAVSYRATDGRGSSSATATVSISIADAIFADGFESGGTSRWSGEGS